jgi:hypothetical protein
MWLAVKAMEKRAVVHFILGVVWVNGKDEFVLPLAGIMGWNYRLRMVGRWTGNVELDGHKEEVFMVGRRRIHFWVVITSICLYMQLLGNERINLSVSGKELRPSVNSHTTKPADGANSDVVLFPPRLYLDNR